MNWLILSTLLQEKMNTLIEEQGMKYYYPRSVHLCTRRSYRNDATCFLLHTHTADLGVKIEDVRAWDLGIHFWTLIYKRLYLYPHFKNLVSVLTRFSSKDCNGSS